MQTKSIDKLLPNYNDGRLFISPILGCNGACSYCYLNIRHYNHPRANNISPELCRKTAANCKEFVWGRNGTIISVGAWGDIFPRGNEALTSTSVSLIKNLLKWGNPVQIMSKNTLSDVYITDIVSSVMYPGQLLYSTTITSLDNWQRIEPCVASPLERLTTCHKFHVYGISTNVLLKPFLPGIMDAELSSISDLLLEYSIDYCTLGIMYLSAEIREKISRNPFLQEHLKVRNQKTNHLDCNGSVSIPSTPVSDLLPHINTLRAKGISAFLKSSCVNANILSLKNPSGYHERNDEFCIRCGNCQTLNIKRSIFE